MPRRRQRFSNLEQQFRESGGQAAPGSRLAGYIAFKRGETKITVTKKLTAAERKRYGFAILPFNLSCPASPTAADRYAAPITVYSNTIRTDLTLSNNQCGYDTIGASTQQADNFYPALLRVFIPSGGAPTNPTSGVTQKPYSRIPGRSGSIPFGRTVTNVTDAKTGAAESALDDVDEEDVRLALSIAARTGGGSSKASSVSYEPEIFRVGKPDLVSPP